MQFNQIITFKQYYEFLILNASFQNYVNITWKNDVDIQTAVIEPFCRQGKTWSNQKAESWRWETSQADFSVYFTHTSIFTEKNICAISFLFL